MAQASAGISGDAGARADSIVRSAAIGLWLVLIAVDFFIPDPITFAWRQVFALALAAGGLAACIAFLFIGHRVLAVLFAAAAALALWQDAQPWFARQQVLARTGADVIDVERHFVIGYTDVATIRSSFGTAISAASSLHVATSLTALRTRWQRRSPACRTCGVPQACRR